MHPGHVLGSAELRRSLVVTQGEAFASVQGQADSRCPRENRKSAYLPFAKAPGALFPGLKSRPAPAGRYPPGLSFPSFYLGEISTKGHGTTEPQACWIIGYTARDCWTVSRTSLEAFLRVVRRLASRKQPALAN